MSRCQIFDFKRITNNDTVEHLQEICEKESIDAEKTALHVIAQKSEGCMRDALSILDKIISFTGGHLGYAQTLEHLNILDEDYYFRLMDALMKEQLTDAMLLFDEINQKGFEGDHLLEGFAEFIRNLLVSKDPKAARLLEVADDFKPKYVTEAAQVSLGWLIAALNIVNEAILQFKQARNKRLHIELALIKLCYLKQAVELMASYSGISKKKRTELTKPVQFRALSPVEIKEAAKKPAIPAARLIIETEKKAEPAVAQPTPVSTAASPATVPAGKLGSLQKLRKQVAIQQQSANPAIALTPEKAAQAWDQYIEKLQADKNNAAVTNFRMSKLEIVDDQNFNIITEAVIQQKFIESEWSGLADHFQLFFNNKMLKFQVILEEKEGADEPVEKPLNTREQYQLLVQQYPLIKDLRDRLKLDLY